MMRLIALRPLPREFKNVKGMRVLPGDEFEMDTKEGRALVSEGKARAAEPDPGDVPPPPPKVAEMVGPDAAATRAEDEVAGLRTKAEALGITIDPRWRAARLHKEIEAARAAG